MKFVLALAAALSVSIVTGPLAALFGELIVLPIFYGTIWEGAIAWGSVYVAGPTGLVLGFLLGGWLVLRSRFRKNRLHGSSSGELFVHE